jgi:cytochrome c-type biogenesis protein CcmH
MISLWLSIGLLSIAALAFVFWPFLRRNTQRDNFTQEDVSARLAENIRLYREHLAELEVQLADGRLDNVQFAQLKLEQERALLDDEASIQTAQKALSLSFGAKSFVLVAGVIIVAALALYTKLGSSADVEIRQLQETKLQLDDQDIRQGKAPSAQRSKDLAALIEARLVQEPEQLQYWFFLARLRMELNDFTKAADAYKEVLARDQQSGMLMAELAQALFLRDGNKMNPVIADLAEKSLKLEPNNTMALGLAGVNAFSNQDYPIAIKHWRRAASILGAESQEAQALMMGVDRAQTLFAANGGTDADLNKALYGKELTLKVSLGDGVSATPEQQVYIYARAWKGAKMPLAITRAKVSELPRLALLNESMAMSPAMSLATATQVELVARISQDGTAIAKPGDWQGTFGPVDMNAIPADIQIVIDQQLQK